VNKALGMDPAQAVLADIELTGIVADDDGVGQEAMRLDTAPQGVLAAVRFDTFFGDGQAKGGLAICH
jgi:hypothetical protein